MSLTFSFKAQEVNVSSSEEMINKSSSAFWTDFLGESSTGYFLLRKGGPISSEEILIEKYDKSFNFISVNEVKSSMGVMGDSKLYRTTLMDHGNIYSFYEGWNKSIRKNSLIVKLSDDDGALQEEEIVLETEPSKNQLKAAGYTYIFSPNGKKLLVYTRKPFVKGAKESLRLQVFSTDGFKSIWKKDITLDNETKRRPNNYLQINNEGVVFLFKNTKISSKENQYSMITVNEEKTIIKEIDLKDNYPAQLKLVIDKDDNLIICSVLANMGEVNRAWQNIQFTKVNSKGEILINTVEPLGTELLKQIVSEKNANKPQYALADYKLKGFEEKSDGGFLIIAERQKNDKKAIAGSQPLAFNYSYSYGGVVVISLKSNGERSWSSFYNKNQSESSKEEGVTFGSFTYSVNSNKLYMVWNYTSFEIDNLKRFRYWKDKNGEKINLDNLYGAEALFPSLLTVINNDGTYEFSNKTFSSLALKDIQEPNAYLMAIDPSISYSTKDGMIILSRMKNKSAKRYKFNKITF